MIDSNISMMLCGAGFTFFAMHSERGEFIRRFLFRLEYFERMFACAFCTGYWVGLLFSLFYHVLVMHPDGWPQDVHHAVWILVDCVAMGMGTGIVAIFIDKVLDIGDAAIHGVSLAQSLVPADDISSLDALESLVENTQPVSEQTFASVVQGTSISTLKEEVVKAARQWNEGGETEAEDRANCQELQWAVEALEKAERANEEKARARDQD